MQLKYLENNHEFWVMIQTNIKRVLHSGLYFDNTELKNINDQMKASVY